MLLWWGLGTQLKIIRVDSMSKLNVMDCAPVDVEILAYHKQGGNFHPVKLDKMGNARMRWHDQYSQYKNHYVGWVPMPEIDGIESKT